MKNKICNSCNAVNGQRATYCRKCGVSLDRVPVIESSAPVKEARPVRRTAPRLAPRATLKESSPRVKINLPERPVKPRVIYWPFVLSLVCAMSMFVIVILFAVFSDKAEAEGNAVVTSSVSSSTGTVSEDQVQTEDPATDISDVLIGDIADQIYRAEPITIAFSISHNDEILVEDTDYTVTYQNNIGVGTATAVFEGIEPAYTGSFSASFNIITGDPVCDDPSNAGKREFIMRLYGGMLGRAPSLDELILQTGRLVSGEISGQELVNEVAFSEECDARGLSDTDFLNAFYAGVLGRPADDEGLSYNVSLLEGGMSRQDLINSIMGAPGGEFENLINSLG